MSTILDALRRAQQTENEAAKDASRAQESERSGSEHVDDGALPEPKAPPPHLVGSEYRQSEGAGDFDDSAYLEHGDAEETPDSPPSQTPASADPEPHESPDPGPKSGSALADRLAALPIPDQLKDWRVPAVVVGGLVIGLVFSSLFGDEQPETVELPAAVAEKMASAARSGEAKPAAPEVPPSAEKAGESKRAARRQAVAEKAANADKGAAENAGAGAAQPAATAGAKQVPAAGSAAKPPPSVPPSPTTPTPAQAAASGPAETPPKPAAPAGADATASSKPAAAAVNPPGPAKPEAAASPAAPASPAKTEGALLAAAQPTPKPPATGANPTPPPAPAAKQPAAPPGTKPPPAGSPAAPMVTGGVSPSPVPDSGTVASLPNSPKAAPPGALPTDVPAAEEIVAELVDAPPEGAPSIDLLFIRWKPTPADRVATVRTGGQRLVVLHENDIIEGMKVSRIDQGGIEFQWRGQRFMVLAARY